MLESIPAILIAATILGFLSGIGIGGGSLLVLWLTLVLKMDYSQVRMINLLFFIPSAVIASIFRWRQGSLNICKIAPAIITGCIAAFYFSLLSTKIELMHLRKLFGILLLIIGIREFFYRPRNAR